MKNLLVGLVVLISCVNAMGCDDQWYVEPLPEATCEAFVSDLYAIPNCGYYNTAEQPAPKIEEAEALRWCKDVEKYVNDQCTVCEELMHEWLVCRPTACTWEPHAQSYAWDTCWGKMMSLLNCDCDQQ